MEPIVVSPSLQDLAIVDPVAALGILLHIPRTPMSFNIPIVFSSFAVNTEVDGSLDTTLTVRTWIDNITYNVQCPNCFANNIFKPGWDEGLKNNPGVSVSLEVVGGPRYIVSENPTPLENFVAAFDKRWPRGWPLYKLQNIKATFLLTQPPGGATSPNVPPYNLTLTFNGWQFLDTTLEDVTPQEATARLRNFGLCIPQLQACND
jgi:hypothetical protein